VSQVTKHLLETVLIKKAKQSLSLSCVVNKVEPAVDMFSNLPNSPSFHVTFDDNGVCVPKWMGKKY